MFRRYAGFVRSSLSMALAFTLFLGQVRSASGSAPESSSFLRSAEFTSLEVAEKNVNSLQISTAPAVVLRADTGETVDFHRANNDKNPLKQLPHLVLYKDGALTAESERTLHITVSNVLIGRGARTKVEVQVFTQYSDPDRGGGSTDPWFIVGDIPPQEEYVPATEAPQTFSFPFAVVFPEEVLEKLQYPSGSITTGSNNIPTPTGYFRVEIKVNNISRLNYRKSEKRRETR